MSSAIVTGAYSLVASALNYWISLSTEPTVSPPTLT